MAMPSDFWAGWITVVTVVTLIALGWLVLSVYFSKEPVDVAHETWDETLREGATPAPLWWFWLILGLMAVSVVYLMLYPGLGTFRGALRWSQGGQIEENLVRYDASFGSERERLAQAPLDALRADERAMRSAGNLFDVHCAACHGADGEGQADLFPNLTDLAWQWGGGEAEVLQTLTVGRQATMPPWEGILGEQGVADVTNYVLGLSVRGGQGSASAGGDQGFASAGSGQGSALAGDGEAVYRTYCSACHGADGAGMAALGAPALNDGIWLYGGTPEAVRHSIAAGRSGQMPAFGGRLDPTQLRLLAAWLTRE